MNILINCYIKNYILLKCIKKNSIFFSKIKWLEDVEP